MRVCLLLAVVLLLCSPAFGVVTVSQQTNSIGYACNGSAVAFVYTFPALATTDLLVKLRTVATGAETTLTLTTHYTATATMSGGTVTTVATYTSAYEIYIERVTSKVQPFVLNANRTQTEVLAWYDRVILTLIELYNRMGNSLSAPTTESDLDMELPSAESRASKYLAFDAAGLPIASSGTTADPTISAFADTFLDDADAGLARATLSAQKQAWIDVTEHPYHATGDGTTLDTAAIQAAIDACPRAGTVFLPAGQYRITSPLTVTYGDNEMSLRGVGEASKIIPDLDATTESAFVLGEDAVGVFNLTFSDFAIVGGKITSIEACTSGWTAGSGDTLTHSSTFVNGGGSSVKIVLAAERSDGNLLAYKDITSLDISDCNAITFVLWSSAAVTASDFELVVSESLHAAGEKTGTYVECLSNAADAGTWKGTELLKTLTSFNAVRSVSLYANATIPTGTTIYLEWISAYERVCLNGIEARNTAGLTFENVNLCCGASNAGFYGEGVISTIFKNCTAAGFQGGGAYSRPSIGWYLKTNTTTSCQSNLNHWISCSSQGNNIGIYVENASEGDISGQYEFGRTADIWLKNCDFFRMSNIYSEGGAQRRILDDCRFCTFDNFYANGGGIETVTGSANTGGSYENSWIWTLDFQDTDAAQRFGPSLWTGTRQRSTTDLVGGEIGIINPGQSPVYYPPIYYTPTGITDARGSVFSAPYAPGEARNYMPNSSFAAWDTTKPLGWAVSNPSYFALTQCGDGLVDTTAHIAPYSVKVVASSYGASYGLNYTINGDALTPFLGRYITACVWTFVPTGEAVKLLDGPAVILSTAGSANGALTGASSWRMTGCEAENTWTRQYVGLYVDTDCTSILFVINGYPTQAAGSVTYYVTEPFIAPGFYGQNGWIPSEGDFHSGVSIHNGSTSAGYVDLYEDSDNGTSYARVTLGTNLAANHTVNIESSEKLLGSASVTMNGTTKATVYTIPTSLSAIVTKVIVRNPSATLAGGTDFNFGDGAAADTWKANVDLSSLTKTTDCIVIFPAAKFTVFNAADAFGIKPDTGSTGAATATIMVYGIEF